MSVVDRVMSGGQTGADRGGLDAATDLGLPHGGLGSALTVSLAESAQKPALTIGLNAQGTFGACLVLGEFLERSKPRTLNIAGMRESEAPGIAADVREIVRRVLWPVTLCEHLRPLADALAVAGIALGPVVSPYVENGSLWFMCGATFDEPALRARLSLPELVRCAEYDGRVAGSDSTFMCTRCDHVILGQHPQYASPNTPRLACGDRLVPDVRRARRPRRCGFGRGEYKYFAYPLPEVVEELRASLYPRLVATANRWSVLMGHDASYPQDHASFLGDFSSRWRNVARLGGDKPRATLVRALRRSPRPLA